MLWIMLHPKMTPEHLGFIPSFLDEADERSAKEQINANYIAGWNRFEGFELTTDNELIYPGDPPLPAVAMTKMHDEIIMLYPFSWVVIMQQNGTWEAARLD